MHVRMKRSALRDYPTRNMRRRANSFENLLDQERLRHERDAVGERGGVNGDDLKRQARFASPLRPEQRQ
jgi:hypothetical protein